MQPINVYIYISRMQINVEIEFFVAELSSLKLSGVIPRSY